VWHDLIATACILGFAIGCIAIVVVVEYTARKDPMGSLVGMGVLLVIGLTIAAMWRF
jgi:hypothetical protein